MIVRGWLARAGPLLSVTSKYIWVEVTRPRELLSGRGQRERRYRRWKSGDAILRVHVVGIIQLRWLLELLWERILVRAVGRRVRAR